MINLCLLYFVINPCWYICLCIFGTMICYTMYIVTFGFVLQLTWQGIISYILYYLVQTSSPYCSKTAFLHIYSYDIYFDVTRYEKYNRKYTMMKYIWFCWSSTSWILSYSPPGETRNDFIQFINIEYIYMYCWRHKRVQRNIQIFWCFIFKCVCYKKNWVSLPMHT